MRAIADGELALYIDTKRFERAHFLDERSWIDDHTIADNSLYTGAKNAAGDEFQYVLLFADEDRVPCVVAALIASDDFEAVGKKIDHLAFTFVAPLGTENNHVTHAHTFPFAV